MDASEGATVTAAERQRIERGLAELGALVTATPQHTPLDFRAIHAVATRLTQATYKGWKKEALAAIAPKPHSEAVRKPSAMRRRETAHPH
jgi:hypothetical protein